MRTLIILISISAALVCCSQENDAISVLELDVDKFLADEKVSIYDIFSDVEVIALDNVFPISNTVHSGEAYITYDGNNFYVLDDRTYKVNVYKKNGDILYQMDKVGRGTGEYTMAYQIEYDPIKDRIDILNPMGKILHYDKDSLKYVSELNFIGSPRSTHNFSRAGDDYVIYSAREEDKLYALSGNTAQVVSFGYTPPEYLRKYISPQSPFLCLNGVPCIFRPYDGLIYSLDLTSRTMTPLIGWDFGKYQCELQDIPRNKSNREYYDFIMDYSKNHIASFINIKSTDNKIFASVILDCETYTLYYDLSSDHALLFKETVEGLHFLPELFYGNVMYKYVDGASLSSFVKRDMLGSRSQHEYDEAIQKEGAAIIKYTLR